MNDQYKNHQPTIYRMQPNGFNDNGLAEWDPMPTEEIESGEPVQRGWLYTDDKKKGLMVGVWDCTPFVSKMSAYSVDEFMFILEGSISIELENNKIETFNAGDAFVIPKGLNCRWIQSTYVRKYFVIFDNSSKIQPIKEHSKLYQLSKDDLMTSVENSDPSQFLGQIPQQNNREYYTDPTGQFITGLWDSTPFERAVAPFNRFELMCILEGEVIMSDGEDYKQKFQAGDVALVEKDAPYKWKSEGYVRKFYCMFIPNNG